MKKTLIMAALLLSSFANAIASVNTDAAKTNYTETQWEYYAAEEYAGGTGTEADPFLIETPEQLMKLAVEIQNLAADDNNWGEDYSKGKFWKQTKDIVLNEDVFGNVSFVYGDSWKETDINGTNLRTFNGIGYVLDAVADYQVFAGTYDGDGHSISGFYCNATGNKSTGIFNNIWGGTVKNLIVKDAYIAANANVGLIAGSIEQGATIINCQTSGIVADGGSYHAGIVGNVNGCKILNCVTDVWTWAKNNVGGVAGKLGNTSYLDNCFYYGWLGSVKGRAMTGDMKYWGAVSPEIGLSESTVTVDNPDDPENPTIVCENPSKALNSFWADSCSVRNQPTKEMVSHNAANSKYGVVENCKAVGIDKIADAVEALNKEAETINGASKWKVGANGMPELTFEYVTTGITSVTGNEDNGSYNIYNVQGVLVKKGVSEADALKGLTNGVYVVNGKKYVVM